MGQHLKFRGVLLVLACACNSETTSSDASGGTGPSTGGSAASSGTGGSPSADGTRSTGGVPSTGGLPTSGGTDAGNAGGGTTNTGGGSLTSGGATNTGGRSPTSGGSMNTGGTGPSSAGATNTGGRNPATGGIASTGGRNPDTGGTADTGGTGPGRGGDSNAGGSVSSGGTTSGGAAGSGGGTTEVGCTRDGLTAAVDKYLQAVQAGDTSLMPLSSSATYSENLKQSTMGSGLWQSALPISFHRNLLDVETCQTFTELFVTEGAHPYVLGTRLVIEDGNITEIETLITDDDDWNFDAAAYQKCSESEDWDPVPAANQSSREELTAAAQAYFDIFSDKSTVVPWGSPCYRLEGGAGCTPSVDAASQSCNVGIPDNITFRDTHWVIDVDINSIVGITLFGGGLPDAHTFRLVDGKIRYVHTVTVMN